MYELIQVSERCFYIQSPAKIGLVMTDEDQVCLIDSGNDKDAGKKVKRILEEKGWTLRAIYNTHSHADHIGGNNYLQKQTGCRIFAPGIERDFTEHTILEPSYIYGGNPPGSLRHKFTMAKGSHAETLEENMLPENMSSIQLPGHSWDMAGFRTEDNVVYLADCLSGRETLEKYRIWFLVDVEAYLNTLERVRDMEAELFIPSHAEPAEDIRPLAEYNISVAMEIAQVIGEICKTPVSFDGILKKVFERYDMTMTFEQHALIGSTVRSYLTWLENREEICSEIDDNTLIWRAR